MRYEVWGVRREIKCIINFCHFTKRHGMLVQKSSLATEGPSVLKHRGLYYLFYSANDFRNINNAVGYATSKAPVGPWEKYANNPIISKQNMHRNGTGHGDFLERKKGSFIYLPHPSFR